MQKPLGAFETQFFAYAQMRRLRTVRLGELAGPLRLTGIQERRLLSQLAQKGLIVRVVRGLYLVPPRLPLGGAWSPNEARALDTLLADAGEGNGGRYQICGPNAFNRYGFDEQLPVRTYVYNNRFSGERQIGTVALHLIKVGDERLGSTEEVPSTDGLVLVYSSRVRTLVDAVYDWSRFDSLPRAYEWIRRELAAKRVNADELIRAILRYGNQGTIRRMGVLFEQERVPEPLLRRLQKVLRPSTSVIPWIPGAPKRGAVNTRWGVVVGPEGRVHGQG